MKKNLPLLLVFVGLAVVWSSWLAYQAYTVADPVVVSAPQLDLAALVVVAQVQPPVNGTAIANITKVYKDDLKPLRKLPGQVSLALPRDNIVSAGVYLLPLRQLEIQKNLYEIVPMPVTQSKNPTPIYVMTESVRLQAERILNVN